MGFVARPVLQGADQLGELLLPVPRIAQGLSLIHIYQRPFQPHESLSGELRIIRSGERGCLLYTSRCV